MLQSDADSLIPIPKLVLLPSSTEDLKNMSAVENSTENEARNFSPQSSSDSAIGGSTSPDEKQKVDSSFSDDREENFESYGENEDVEYES